MSRKEKKEIRQQLVCNWLDENYLQFGNLRHDLITDRLQVKAYPQASGDEANGEAYWRNLTDKDLNTMVCQCATDTEANITGNEMWTALKSDMVPAVHPIRAWLSELKPYTPDQPDWIDMVAQQVKVKPSGESNSLENAASGYSLEFRGEENNTTPSYTTLHTTTPSADRLWRQCFKKWFVAMVASWMKDEVVNHTVLVLVGRQGIFKTTWLDHLIPPALRMYSSKLPLSGQISKDDRLRLCENGMLNIDELDAIRGREMNIVKSLLTSTDVNERAAYGRLKERRMRLASFCASTNKREFLTDITGNRRWLPFEVESIQNPFFTTLPYDLMYAQAKALVDEGRFSYWFDMEEIDVLEMHNEDFRAQENEEQLLTVYFAVPAKDAKNAKFLTTAEISDKLISFGNIKRPMSLNKLGMLLRKYGFIASRKGTPARRGWVVYERDSDDINSERKLLSKASIANSDSIF